MQNVLPEITTSEAGGGVNLAAGLYYWYYLFKLTIFIEQLTNSIYTPYNTSLIYLTTPFINPVTTTQVGSTLLLTNPTSRDCFQSGLLNKTGPTTPPRGHLHHILQVIVENVEPNFRKMNPIRSKKSRNSPF